jgi:Cdc6-like AAA superfamily ATPase
MQKSGDSDPEIGNSRIEELEQLVSHYKKQLEKTIVLVDDEMNRANELEDVSFSPRFPPKTEALN